MCNFNTTGFRELTLFIGYWRKAVTILITVVHSPLELPLVKTTLFHLNYLGGVRLELYNETRRTQHASPPLLSFYATTSHQTH